MEKITQAKTGIRHINILIAEDEVSIIKETWS